MKRKNKSLNKSLLIIALISIFLFLSSLVYLLKIIYNYENYSCPEIDFKKIVGFNSSIEGYGGYSCYKRGDTMDMYFSPAVVDESGTIWIGKNEGLYHIRCFQDNEYCIMLEHFDNGGEE